MTTFRIADHSVIDGRGAVEIYSANGDLLGVLYVVNDKTLRLISKHFDRVEIDERPPPVVNILLKDRADAD
jgi:hypothetical protein